MPYRFINKIGLLLVILLGIGVNSADLSAQTSQGLAVRPAIIDTAFKSASQEHSVFIANTSDQAVAVVATAKQLTTQDEYVDLIARTRYDLSPWVKFSESSFLLEQGEEKEIFFSIDPPKLISPGSYYGQLAFQIVNPLRENSSATSPVYPEVNALIFLTMGGETVSNMEINQTLDRTFSLDGKLVANITVANSGNTHDLARVFLRAKQIGGSHAVSAEADLQIILPGTKRVLSLELDTDKLFARYRVWAEVIAGSPSTTISTAAVQVLIISPWLIIAVTLRAMMALTLGLRGLARKKHHFTNKRRRIHGRLTNFLDPRLKSEKDTIKRNR